MSLPTHIGRYRILEILGQGAMGVVYRARDEGLDRDVAVKVIRGESLDEGSHAQFLKEARAAARLQHPGIVTVYELGQEGGAPFLAMELLEGQDLEHAMRQGRLSDPRRALAVIEQVLAALGHAHARGIVHRDVKPSNVFLHGGTQAKILDFGVARLGEGLTLTGRVVGTPHYMSPEQIRADRVDGRSDLFSTALIFYEMVTGAKAYRAGSAVTVMYQIVHEDADLSRLPATPGGAALLAVLRRALSRDREGRYPDAASLAAALSQAVSDHADRETTPPAFDAASVLSAPPSEPAFDTPAPVPPLPDLDLPLTPQPVDAPAEPPTRALAWSAAAVLASALVAGAVLWWWQTRESSLETPTIKASMEPPPALPPTRPTPGPSIEASVSSSEIAPPSATAPDVVPGAPAATSLPAVAPETAPSPPPATAPPPGPASKPRPSSPIPPSPLDLEARLDHADQLFQSGHLRAALTEARAILRDHPENVEARYLADDIELDLKVEDHLGKARAALARGDRDTARREAEAGLALKPNESRLTALLRELGRP
jgi:serine/threonine protein kinase